MSTTQPSQGAKLLKKFHVKLSMQVCPIRVRRPIHILRKVALQHWTNLTHPLMFSKIAWGRLTMSEKKIVTQS